MHNCFTDNRQTTNVGTCKTLLKIKECDSVYSFAEPICLIGKPSPLPIVIFSLPSYGVTFYRGCTSAIIWWCDPVSTIQESLGRNDWHAWNDWGAWACITLEEGPGAEPRYAKLFLW